MSPRDTLSPSLPSPQPCVKSVCVCVCVCVCIGSVRPSAKDACGLTSQNACIELAVRSGGGSARALASRAVDGPSGHGAALERRKRGGPSGRDPLLVTYRDCWSPPSREPRE